MDSVDNLANLRVASFSYYLKSNDQENFMQKLMSSEQNPLSSIKPTYSLNFSKSIDSPENPHVKQLSAYLNDPQESFRFKVKRPSMDTKSPTAGSGPNLHDKIKSNDGEIDIFGADKYFNMKLEYPAMMKQENIKNDRLVDVVPYVINSNLKQDAPSICSETSTWSSGVALLQNLPRSKSQKKPKSITRRRFLASISCTGPCFDRESVEANNNSKEKCEIHQSGSKSNGENFTFPLVDVMKPSLKFSLKKLEDQEIEDLRKSIEVYGSNTMKKDEIRKNLERSLSMLTWDAIPKSKSRPPTTSDVTTTACDDMASDVSSDLFEIENISATCGGYMMNRDSVEDVSSCMTPTTQYAPSEASFEWSVKTASAVDFSSAVSDYDLKNVGVSGNEFPTQAMNSIRIKDAHKSRPGGLLGCKSLKSLSVAETVHKTKVERY